ncbi:sugar O-acetyltransferase [Shewanella oneidensis MR-1]|uniref:Acetyltransferase n=1 Tax=Shewanella oneidensis (strain ATCC 700550 / JCM 31522 / CIP 106686 / LMG 19005 / NCIMB 14063 / MR-1) TaxID=211586 RepID=Q8EFL0_SHEON|nr:sugar O-acetyltransferase [Shewanella oneidensis]AAN55012.1 maltose O-acetyltransferase Maa [Shewanella oneidensis MR-1]MDX5996280.1 sugar O-acetyltransferase [Shewanella oneidensis]QKG96604.1 sugar O-acetyltransferase [Shewanella oneidensis MR-1]
MTEKQKMLAGQPYKAWDDALLAERMRAKSICHQFNQADPTLLDARMAHLRGLLDIPACAHIEPNFFCDYGYNIHIGKQFYANHNLTILDVCSVLIGDNVMFGPHVMISTATHPIDPIARQTIEYGAPIQIGNNVWLGGNVSVLPGVIIGDNCVIGAGSVVNKSIPSNCVAAGNPCKVIKPIDVDYHRNVNAE